ncbi:hypothetical protein ADL00_18305 [Streptomyces sp. AS58]|nr:hypothetical protein ADL00_18305 [Streptomyces sp. AS58]
MKISGEPGTTPARSPVLPPLRHVIPRDRGEPVVPSPKRRGPGDADGIPREEPSTPFPHRST